MPVERYLVDLLLLATVVSVQVAGARMFLAMTASPAVRSLLVWGTGLSLASLVFALSLRFSFITQFFPEWVPGWGRGVVILWAFFSVLLICAIALVQRIPVNRSHSPARRAFLRTAQAAAIAAPFAATGYGTFVQRFDFRLREQNIVIPDLAEDLHGLRLVQLTDIHLSPFLSVRELEHVIGMANETHAHAALVTGDLISRLGDPLDACLDRLSRLRTDAGTLGCLGNHEVYADAEEYVARRGAQLGMRFLRDQAEPLRFGQASINFAGVDYQPTNKPYLPRAERLVVPGALNVMLSHNPDVFPVAAEKGYALTISGHTHGGQIRVEILHQNLSMARFFTPYTDGLYEENGAQVFVSRGIGTIGLPTRLGAPPEVALLTLCRSSS